MDINIQIAIENIFPLTIISTRFGTNIVIFQAYPHHDFISEVAENEEISYDLVAYLEKEMPTYNINWGIGKNINEAIENFFNRNEHHNYG